MLTSRGASLEVKEKVHRACIQSVWGYASETWAMKVLVMARLERTERLMIRWMCDVRLKSRTASAELNSQLGIECNRCAGMHLAVLVISDHILYVTYKTIELSSNVRK